MLYPACLGMSLVSFVIVSKQAAAQRLVEVADAMGSTTRCWRRVGVDLKARAVGPRCDERPQSVS